jgi:hypothetical protein
VYRVLFGKSLVKYANMDGVLRSSVTPYFILTPGRHAGLSEQENDGEPFEKKNVPFWGDWLHAFQKQVRSLPCIRHWI